MKWVLDEMNVGRLSVFHPDDCRHNEVLQWAHDPSKGICNGCGYIVKRDVPKQETWAWGDMEAEFSDEFLVTGGMTPWTLD